MSSVVWIRIVAFVLALVGGLLRKFRTERLRGGHVTCLDPTAHAI